MQKIHSVEEYIEVNPHYAESLTILRNIINSTALEETVKWNMPTYCLNGKNVLGIGAFKKHFCLWFHNGIFLKDQHNLLINAQENKTKALRQMRFETKIDINKSTVLAYVKEAIENQRIGKEIKPNRATKTVSIPLELYSVLSTDKTLMNSYNKLTPSRQREFSEYITEAKKTATKQTRLDKIIPLIIAGVGLHDKYKNC